MAKPTSRTGYENMARNLFYAYIAARMGFSFATAKKHYGDQTPGDYWFDLAEQVNQDMARAMNEILTEKPDAQIQ